MVPAGWLDPPAEPGAGAAGRVRLALENVLWQKPFRIAGRAARHPRQFRRGAEAAAGAAPAPAQGARPAHSRAGGRDGGAARRGAARRHGAAAGRRRVRRRREFRPRG